MNRPRILIVDDKPANLVVLERILESLEVDIVKASSGNEAVFATMEQKFALVLLDVQMPEMDGFETAEFIRREKKNRDLPVVFISAIHTDDYYKIKGVEAGGIDFITKPIVEDILIGKVRLFLQLHQYREELKEAAERAEQASLAKSDFLARMSHDIRTPLNAILGFAELLGRLEDEPQRKHFVENILTSGHALLTILNDILDLSKIEAGKLGLQYSPVSIRKLVMEMETVFSQRASEKGIALRIKVAKSIPDAVILDELRLRQILLNLLGNAIKFTESGTIQIDIRCDLAKVPDAVDLKLMVSDTGSGIPDDEQQEIFQPFQQVQSQDTKKFGGTGLGLAITHSLVTMMGGQVKLESSLGKGSTFTVSIPGVKRTALASLRSRETGIPHDKVRFEKAKVLIVDDVDMNREILAALLGEYHFEILEAENGVQALEQVKSHRPNLILLDMLMPIMDGYEASAKLKQDVDTRDIPVVAITASALKEEEENILKTCDGYVRKPLDPDELLSMAMHFLPYRIETESP